ncbi:MULTISPECIES: choice-of-anchor D domain-containing protein [unclassified Leptolyngbya]|uniref:choice-of-anchor D domain-containing protein n=1 Tax=unclassified Leptolyngbya TaxID=2650499 RepID=UPI001688769A|nr:MULTISPECIES: choice-of-anchor D domain-containing protein [unclassified Leptolyngbya]MBD1912522.1 choice-of-anchor D domain-containing protein [Leptolyngbya sp. FACHB-8]MBD2156467.1 choice-of-anchor D domain-containing protein [Leptolyngbya sp. FACHB-16]
MVPYGSTRTDQGQLLTQAQQGNPEAIAFLLNRALNPRGVRAQVQPDTGDGLTVLLESAQVPSQQQWVPFIQQGLSQLHIPNVQRVRCVGRQIGQADYAWQEATALYRPSSPSPPAGGSGFPLTQFEVGSGSAVGQQIVYGDKALQLTPHGAVVMASAYHQAPAIRTRPVPEPEAFIRPMAAPIGRQEELEGAIAALQSQPVEFYGDLGVGKTTLVRSLVYHPAVRTACPDGILYHNVQDEPPDDLLKYLFDTFFEYDEPIPHKPTPDQIYQSFRGRRALIALDDVQLNSVQVAALANQLPSLHLLLGSPNHHGLPESFAMPLAGLPMPEAIAFLETQLGRSLGPENQVAAETLCRAVMGNPLRLRQAIALVRNRHLTLPGLAQHMQNPAALELLVLRACATLPEPERRILAALGVLGAVPVRSHHFAGMTGLQSPQGALDHLEQRGLVVSDGQSYTLAANLLPLLQKHWNLAGWVQPVINYFLLWAQKHAPVTGALAQESHLLLWVMERAAHHQQWSEVLRLARAMDGSFLVSGLWGRWEQIWRFGLQASEALGDQEAIAHAYHQLGTRALCLDDPFTANAYLAQARVMRESFGQPTAANASYHNLQWLSAAPAGLNPGVATELQGAITPDATVAYPPDSAEAERSFTLMAPPAKAEREGLPPAAQVALMAAAFLGVGSLLAVYMYRNQPGLAVNPTQLTFSAQPQHRTSQPQTVRVQNTGDDVLEITRVSLEGNQPTDFQIASNACEGVPLAPDQSCEVQITFTPQGDGTRLAELTLSDRNQRIERRVQLSGTSSATAPGNPITLSFQPGNLDFGDYAVNQASESRRIVLRNESGQPITIQGISPVGEARLDFPTTHDCTGAPLVPGQSCSINMIFRPSVAGRRAANLAVTDTANNLWNVPLSGNGVTDQPQVPALSIRPGTLNFGEQPVQTSSAEQVVTLSNSGTQTLNISQIGVESGNAFAIRRNTCTRTPLEPGNDCTVGVVFSPQAGNAQSGQLTVASNDPRGNARIFLTGTGTVPSAAQLTITPINLDFGAIELESSSRPQTVTLRNTGTAGLTIGQIRASGNGDFVSDTDGAIGQVCTNRALQPGEECRFGVVFLPYVEGDRVAQITIPSDAPQGSVAVQLRGQGQVQRFPTLSVSPASLSFGVIPVGSSSPPQTITLLNSGGVPLNIGNLAIGGANANDFIPANTGSFTQIACSNTVLEPGQRCQLQILFGPLEAGDRQGQLIIPSNDPNGEIRSSLTGSGQGEVAPTP